jgi:hypothetical protein
MLMMAVFLVTKTQFEEVIRELGKTFHIKYLGKLENFTDVK